VVDDLDDANPKDIAYAYSHSGYAPLSVRLAQAAVKGPWKAIEESLKAVLTWCTCARHVIHHVVYRCSELCATSLHHIVYVALDSFPTFFHVVLCLQTTQCQCPGAR